MTRWMRLANCSGHPFQHWHRREQFDLKNISWSIQKRFQEGIAFGNPRSVYGYTDGETNKDWVIVEEQAKVVRFIFDEFLLGKSSYKISNELNERESFIQRDKMAKRKCGFYPPE